MSGAKSKGLTRSKGRKPTLTASAKTPAPSLPSKAAPQIRASLSPIEVQALSPQRERGPSHIEAKATEAGTVEIDIYGEIGYYGVSASQFRQTMKNVSAERLIVNINSPGGDVFDGVAIYNDLLAFPGEVVVRVRALAASAASIIAMAGDKIEIASNAFIMIHNAWTVSVGDQRAMTAAATTLAKIDEQLAATYAARADVDAAEAADMMNAETWLNADDAIEMGFADAKFDVTEKAKAAFDLTQFKNVPRALKPRRASQKAKVEAPIAAPVKPDLSALLAVCAAFEFSLAA